MEDDFRTPADRESEEDDLVGAGLILVMFFAFVVGIVVAAGLWSQALALAAGIWIGKRSKAAR